MPSMIDWGLKDTPWLWDPWERPLVTAGGYAHSLALKSDGTLIT